MQTLYPALFVPRPKVRFHRKRWATPDRDFIALAWVDGPESAPLVALFHGLEGCSRSHYALSFMHAVQRAGWRGVVACWGWVRI